MHEVYYMRRGDVAFFEKWVQLGPGGKKAADILKTRFNGGKGDKGRKGAVAVRTKGSGGVEGGGWKET